MPEKTCIDCIPTSGTRCSEVDGKRIVHNESVTYQASGTITECKFETKKYIDEAVTRTQWITP